MAGIHGPLICNNNRWCTQALQLACVCRTFRAATRQLRRLAATLKLAMPLAVTGVQHHWAAVRKQHRTTNPATVDKSFKCAARHLILGGK